MPVFTVPAPQPLLRPGTYQARVGDIELRDGGDRSFLVWTFELPTRSGMMRVKATSSVSLGPRSKARAWIEALLGRPLSPGESVDTDALIGLPCLVVVGQRQREDGATLNSVEAVLPAPEADAAPF